MNFLKILKQLGRKVNFFNVQFDFFLGIAKKIWAFFLKIVAISELGLSIFIVLLVISSQNDLTIVLKIHFDKIVSASN